MRYKKVAFVAVSASLALGTACAVTTWQPSESQSAAVTGDVQPSTVQSLSQSFSTGIVSYGYEASNGAPDGAANSFYFANPTNCFADGAVCYFSNPGSPYGVPAYNNRFEGATNLLQNEALVLFMVTPPTSTYFGVTPYVFTKYYPSLQADGVNDYPYLPVFESLGDTVNETEIRTLGASDAGPYNQLAVFVMTADTVTSANVAKELAALGIPASSVNLMTIPVNAANLQMGDAAKDDAYTLLLRFAYPQSVDASDQYIDPANAPNLFSLVKVTPVNGQRPLALPAQDAKVPGDGIFEDAGLLAAEDLLVQQLESQYDAGYQIQELPTRPGQTINYYCYSHNAQCYGDNSDAIYTRDTENVPLVDGGTPNTWTPGDPDDSGTPQDRLLIVGVDHVLTKKATYISVSVDDDLHQAGVGGVADVATGYDAGYDTWMRGTARLLSGVVDAGDKLYGPYGELYSFMIGYDCAKNDPTCFPIPTPPEAGAPGVAIGQAIDVTSRVYLDPVTGTRPLQTPDGGPGSEIIAHRVFLMKKRH